MIESPQNEKLKLVRKLRERKHREREGLFATEGEDLLEAGLAAGATPRFVLVAAGPSRLLQPHSGEKVAEAEAEDGVPRPRRIDGALNQSANKNKRLSRS